MIHFAKVDDGKPYNWNEATLALVEITLPSEVK